MGTSLVGEMADMPAASPSLADSMVRRCLAIIMAFGALFLGLGAVAQILMGDDPASAKPFPWWAAAALGLFAWICAYIAMLLWTNRSFPRWLLGIFLYGLPIGLLFESLATRDLQNGLQGVGLLAMSYWNTRSFMFPPKKDRIPEL